MKVLNIVEAAYRGTLEEQDDTIVWICHAMKGANADIDVLLRGNAVNYAVRQACPPLHIGKATINHPAQPNDDLAKLKGKGAAVYVVHEDLVERGIDPRRCVEAAQQIRRAEVANLLEQHDQVWHW